MVDQTRRVVEDFVFCLLRGDPMRPVLYHFSPSPPCRAVRLLARMVGCDLELKIVNVLVGDHLKDYFVKLNPQHTIPTINDHGLVLWESRAIMTYLVAAYAKEDSLYPADIRVRAVVDQRLQFDLGTLYPRLFDYYLVALSSGQLDPSKEPRLNDALAIFEITLTDRSWVAATHFTVADISLAVTVSQLIAFGHDLSKFGQICEWFARCKAKLEPYGYEEINQRGADMLAEILQSKIADNLK